MKSSISTRLIIAILGTAAFAGCPSPAADPPGPDAGRPQCGNGICDSDETPESCPEDCHPEPRCGDGVCNGSETQQTCPADCGTQIVCGNGVCETGETAASCPADCDSKLLVNNNSSYVIYNLYVAPCGATAWGNDQLGASVIGSGLSWTVEGVPPGCYNFLAETSGDANYWETPSGVTLTQGETYTWGLSN